MAIVSKMVSDLTGTEGNESDFVQLVVRQHPSIDSPRQLDVLPDEVKSLKNAKEVVVCEVKGGDGDGREVVMTLTEFRKLCSDDKVSKARGTRGRRKGWSPNATASANGSK